jgi:hypothetical protein
MIITCIFELRRHMIYYFSGLSIVLQLCHSLYWIPDVVVVPGCVSNSSLHTCLRPTQYLY